MGSSPLTFLIQTKAIGARQLHVRVLGSVVLIEVGNLVDFIAQWSRKEVIEAENGEACGSRNVFRDSFVSKKSSEIFVSSSR